MKNRRKYLFNNDYIINGKYTKLEKIKTIIQVTQQYDRIIYYKTNNHIIITDILDIRDDKYYHFTGSKKHQKQAVKLLNDIFIEIIQNEEQYHDYSDLL